MKENRERIWRAHIREWERSGLSQRRYCEEREIALSTFQWWRSRLRKAGSSSTGTSMVQLPVVVGAAVRPPELVVEVGRFRITVRGNFDREQLIGLLDVVENR